MIETIRVTPESNDICEIELVGKLFLAEAAALQSRFVEAAASGAKHLLIRCERLQQMDSTVLRAIIAGIRILHEKTGGKIAFAELNPHIGRLLTITGLAQYCYIAKTRGEALAMLQGSEDTTESAVQ
jgi:anti-anti-sigma factor